MKLEFSAGITWCKKTAVKKKKLRTILGYLPAVFPNSSFKLDVLGFSLDANTHPGRVIFRNRILSFGVFFTF